MKVLERKNENEKTKKDYKKVVWFYDFWSWITESKATKYVIKFAEIKDRLKISQYEQSKFFICYLRFVNNNKTKVGLMAYEK